jgi:Trypsin-co-occurring domain 1
MSNLSVQINGQEVLIEAEPVYGSEDTGVGDVVEHARDAFERATQTISNVSKSMVQAVRSLQGENRPNEFSLEFGIKFKVDGSVMIASTSGEATLTVKMMYKHSPESTPNTASKEGSPS